MAVVEPYSPCPCGSGQKFKWCCQKVEAYAERAQRLLESGQNEAAVQALDEGLKKEPGNAWLLTRKALYLTRAGKVEPAKGSLGLVLAANPKHAGAQMLMTRLVLETEGASAGAARLQQALTAFPGEARRELAGLVKVVAAFLAEASEYPAALRHLSLARALDRSPEGDPAVGSTLRSIEMNPAVSPWLKNPDALSPAPEGLSGDAAERFRQALGWAEEGLWSSAAAAFETLSDDRAAGPAALRNLGFCRLWLADYASAVSALRRYAARLGATTEAVDIEALCQQVEPTPTEELVEHVQLVWPVRDRAALVAALTADPAVNVDEPAPIEPEDEDSPVVDQFTLLDRPEVKEATADLKASDVPKIEARVFVGPDSVAVETFDDGRLDRVSHRFTALAGHSVPPAHPKTKVVGKVDRLGLALMWDWLLPEGTTPQQAKRLTAEQGVHLIGTVWPDTPNAAFRGRTPLKAARDGDAEVPLRAAVFQFQQSREGWRSGFDFGALRVRLNIPAEPEIDPETADVATLHLARLCLIPADRLGDEPLAQLYLRARGAGLEDALGHAANALAGRPETMEKVGLEPLSIYTDLATLASGRDRNDEAFALIKRGREAEPAAKRARNAAAWDIFEIRLRARTEDPAQWVPDLAVLLERNRADAKASQMLMMNLVDMGLLEMVNNPDRPGEILLDSRPLQALMAEYGPRVTTASGRLGVSATKPEIWTPGSEAPGGGSGGLWTPGGGTPPPTTPSPPPPGGGGSRLIIPGR